MQETGEDHEHARFVCIKPFRSLIKTSWSPAEQCGHPAEGVIGQAVRQQWEGGPYFQQPLVVEPVEPARMKPGSDCPPILPPS